MKRVVIAIVLIAFVTTISVYSYFDLKRTGNEIISSLEKTIETAEANGESSAMENLTASVKKWEKARVRFGIYCNHDEIDDIDINFRTLKSKAEQNTDCDIIEICSENIILLEKMIDAEKPKIENVF